MKGISKLSEKCKACPKRDKCDRKRMELCGYLEPQDIFAEVSTDFSENAAQPVLISDVIGEDLCKKLYESLYCAFKNGA